jgi:hypothetical protein
MTTRADLVIVGAGLAGSAAAWAAAAPAQASSWPVFICQDGSDNCYGLPGGRDGQVPGAMKIGEHAPGATTTASGRDFHVDPASGTGSRALSAGESPASPAPRSTR